MLDAWETKKLTEIYEELCSLPQSQAFLHPLVWRGASASSPAGVVPTKSDVEDNQISKEESAVVNKPKDFVDCDLVLIGEDLRHNDLQSSQEFWDDLHLISHNAHVYVDLHMKSAATSPQDHPEFQQLLLAAADFEEAVSHLETSFKHALEGHKTLALNLGNMDSFVDETAEKFAELLHSGWHDGNSALLSGAASSSSGGVTSFFASLLTGGTAGTSTDLGSGGGTSEAHLQEIAPPASATQTSADAATLRNAADRNTSSVFSPSARSPSILKQNLYPSTPELPSGRQPRIFDNPREYLKHAPSLHSLSDQFVQRGLELHSLNDVRNFLIQVRDTNLPYTHY
ncbi:unnamed protein product [Amoebophrya sp. A120]|nr:unnamed protein product [Amoebophrya sp. A120]|eukprot:GSA120T00007764001.1